MSSQEHEIIEELSRTSPCKNMNTQSTRKQLSTMTLHHADVLSHNARSPSPGIDLLSLPSLCTRRTASILLILAAAVFVSSGCIPAPRGIRLVRLDICCLLLALLFHIRLRMCERPPLASSFHMRRLTLSFPIFVDQIGSLGSSASSMCSHFCRR